MNLFTYAFDNPIRFIDPSGTEPTSAGLDDTTRAEMAGLGFTLDETGSFYEDPGAGEKVEITGTGTSDPLGSCVAAGNCRAISSRADITSDVLAVYKSNRTLDAQTYNVLSESDPEGAQAMLDKEVDRKYSRLVADAEAKMSKNDRVMGGALPFLVVAAIISATGALGAVPTTAAGLAPGTVVKGAFGGLNATILGLQLFDMTLAGEGLIAELLGIPRSGSGDETGTPVAAGAVIGGPADISTIPGVEGYQTDMTTTRFDGRTLHVHLTATAHGGGAGQQINSAAVDAFVDYYTAVAAARGAIALRVTGTLTGANHVVSIAPVVLIRTGVNVLPSPRFRFPIRIR